MRIVINKYFTKLLAEDGKVICSMDGEWTQKTRIKEVDLGIEDSPENYFEMDEIDPLLIDEEESVVFEENIKNNVAEEENSDDESFFE